jgi:hypothetical protein
MRITGNVLHNYLVTLECGVSFMDWQPKGERVRSPLHGETHGNFFVIPEGGCIRPNHLPKAQQTSEASVQLSIEHEVVMDG